MVVGGVLLVAFLCWLAAMPLKAWWCARFHDNRSLVARNTYGDCFKCRTCGREWWGR